jgi:hypothetical protein
MPLKQRFGGRLIAAAALSCALALSGLTASRLEAQELTFELAPAEALKLAHLALARGKFDLAAQIARQILMAKPGNASAQLVLLAAQARGGQPHAAVALGKQVFAATPDPKLRFQAAYLTAEALAAQDKTLQAKWWLRRSDRFGESENDRALLRRGFQGLDRRSPLRLDLSFSGGPSANVNGGSLHDSLLLWGFLEIPIPEALSGFSTLATAKLSYRLVNVEGANLSLFATLRDQRVWLSDAAKRADPTAKGSDYGSFGGDLGVSARWLANPRLMLNASAQSGTRSYGNGQRAKVQQLRFGAQRALAHQMLLGFDLVASASQNPERAVLNTTRLGVQASLSRDFSFGTVSAQLGGSVTDSEAAGQAYRAATLGMSYDRPEIVAGIGLEVFGQIEMRDYWKAPMDRPDLRLQAGVSADLRRLSVMGYVPSVSLTATRSFSDLELRDTSDLSLAFGLNSSF